jgi:hypothetical protein
MWHYVGKLFFHIGFTGMLVGVDDYTGIKVKN